MKEYNVIVTEKAVRQLENHIEFIAKVNKNSAKTKKQEIIDALQSLKTMPTRYPFFDDAFIADLKYRKMFIKNWYIVLFKIENNTVYVDYIIDARMNPDIF